MTNPTQSALAEINDYIVPMSLEGGLATPYYLLLAKKDKCTEIREELHANQWQESATYASIYQRCWAHKKGSLYLRWTDDAELYSLMQKACDYFSAHKKEFNSETKRGNYLRGLFLDVYEKQVNEVTKVPKTKKSNFFSQAGNDQALVAAQVEAQAQAQLNAAQIIMDDIEEFVNPPGVQF